jgi:hypothetical protein
VTRPKAILVDITSGDVKIFDATAGNTSVLSGYEIESPSGSLNLYPTTGHGASLVYKGGSLENTANATNNEPVGSSSLDPTGSQGAGNGGFDNFVPASNTHNALAEGSPSDTSQDPLYNSANTNVPSLANGGFDLGDVFKGLSGGGVEDLAFVWSDGFRSDGSVDTFEPSNGTVVTYTPEPTSLSLIGFAGLGLLTRRRRQTSPCQTSPCQTSPRRTSLRQTSPRQTSPDRHHSV